MADAVELTEAEISAACDAVWVVIADPAHSAMQMVRAIVDAVNHQRTGSPAVCGEQNDAVAGSESCIRPVGHAERGMHHCTISAFSWRDFTEAEKATMRGPSGMRIDPL